MYLNTQSGLTGALDTIGQLAAANQQNDAQLRGLAAGGVAGLTPADAPKGVLSGILGSLGIGGQQPGAAPVAPQQAALPAAPAMTLNPSSQGGGVSSAPNPAINQYASYIGQAAQARGIDPMTAIRVAMSEGGMAPNRAGDAGSSFGPFQLHYGGVAGGGNAVAGLGDDFTKATGLDARDPANWQKTVDFALDHAAKNGWSAFHGAARAGLDAYAGITKGASAAPAAQAIASATGGQGGAPMPLATSDAAAPASGASATAPNIDQIRALVQNPATRSLGLQLWQQAISPKDGFTLKPGEQRFDARGRELAAVAAAPVALSAGQSLVPAAGGAPIAASPAAKSMRIVQIGEDQYGNKQFGTLDENTGKMTPVAAPAAASGAPAGDPNLHGKDYLSTLNPQIAAQVQAYAEGRVKLPTGQGANSPFARQIRAAVLQYDPNFDATDTDARFKTRLDFSPGAGPNSAGVAIQAGNTAIQHLGELSDAAEELHNSRLPIMNSITQGIGSATGGNLAGTKFQTALQNYTDEITKFYRGTGGTESEIQARMKSLSPTMSPDQLKTAIATEVDLLHGKINALQDRWHQGMGPTAGDFPIVQPKSQAALDRIASRTALVAGGTPAPAAPPAPAASIPTLTDPSQVAKLPPGTQFRTPDGRLKVAP